jgi:hypothetical protein
VTRSPRSGDDLIVLYSISSAGTGRRCSGASFGGSRSTSLAGSSEVS